ncbi:MAG: hypothetical protein JNJ73_13760 [Hyphomonadaceae bacterium]|nr:hypothetical protein [Hyphomonadaceae bacterium]
MADGAIMIELDGELADQVREAAAARGLTPEDYARQVLAFRVGDEEDLDWDEDIRRLDEPGENIPLDEAFDRFKDKVAEARAKTK